MNEISWFNDYSDMFSLELITCLTLLISKALGVKKTIQGLELTIIQVQRVSDQRSQRKLWKQTTYQHRTSPGFL